MDTFLNKMRRLKGKWASNRPLNTPNLACQFSYIDFIDEFRQFSLKPYIVPDERGERGEALPPAAPHTDQQRGAPWRAYLVAVSYTHLRAHET